MKKELRNDDWGDPNYEGRGIDICSTCHRPTLFHPLGQLCAGTWCCDDRLNHYTQKPGTRKGARKR